MLVTLTTTLQMVGPCLVPHFPSQLSRSMMKHHLEQSTLAQRSEKEELQRLRKIASSIAKEVKHFWESVRKVVQCYCT